jgi:hypothetical protein
MPGHQRHYWGQAVPPRCGAPGVRSVEDRHATVEVACRIAGKQPVRFFAIFKSSGDLERLGIAERYLPGQIEVARPLIEVRSQTVKSSGCGCSVGDVDAVIII